ncbi:unnamed protein product [Brassica oleracea]
MISKTKLFSLRFDVHEKFTVKEILDSFNQVEISEVLVCDGLLLCVTVTRDEYSQRLMLWNPYLGQTRWIQTRRSYDRSDVYALGYDKSTNRNHKILMYCYGYKEDECEIYDVKSDSWRTLDVKLHWGWGEEYFHVSASLKGNTYFLDRDGHDEMFTGFLVCFDFTTERFGELLPLPLEEKLAALYMRSPISGMGIWVTTKTEPNKLLWSNFFKINLEAIPRTSRFRTRSFFIDEEKKRFFFFLMAVLPIPSPRRILMFMCVSGTNLSVFKRDIDELIGEFVEGDLTSFADMKRVWLSRKFSYVYEALPSSNLVFFIQSLLAHAIVEANDKGVEIATALVKLMLDRKVFIFGAVDFDEACTTRGESRQFKQWVHYW